MPFGFFGKGLAMLGKGITSGVNKLGELGQMEGGDAGAASGGVSPQLKRPSVLTPGINPNAPMPDIGGGKDGMFAKGIDLINRQQPQPNAMPTLPRPDVMPAEPLRESVEVSANLPMGRAEASPLAGQMVPTREIKPVRPPDFLGTPGSTMDDTPMNHRRYQYQTEHMRDGKIPRRWQDIAMNALQGAAQGFQSTGDLSGALGGAIAGGAGTAISPLHGRDFRFRNEQMPRLMEQQAETERLQDRGFETQKRGADLEGVRARTQATIAGTKDPELERRKTEAAISKAQAQAEAIATGKPQKFLKYDPQTGEYLVGWKYPDGREDFSGQSGEMKIKQEGFENQQKMNTDRIVGGMERVKQSGKQALEREQYKQKAQTGRTAMTQDRIDRRQKEKLGSTLTPPINSVPYGPPIKRASKADINDFAREKKITPAEAKARFEAKGYIVE